MYGFELRRDTMFCKSLTAMSRKKGRGMLSSDCSYMEDRHTFSSVESKTVDTE